MGLSNKGVNCVYFIKKYFTVLVALFGAFVLIGIVKKDSALDLNSGKVKYSKYVCGFLKINESVIDTKFYLLIKKHYSILPKSD